jgi:hypothetical protein
VSRRRDTNPPHDDADHKLNLIYSTRKERDPSISAVDPSLKAVLLKGGTTNHMGHFDRTKSWSQVPLCFIFFLGGQKLGGKDLKVIRSARGTSDVRYYI